MKATMDLFGSNESSAVISPDGLYRYSLQRKWGESGRRITFIGLNPSTADSTTDDPTIRRCIGFAKAWGGTSLSMVNLFALRSTNPKALFLAPDPIGPENDEWLERIMCSSDLIVAAWGNHGSFLNRASEIVDRFADRLHALAITGQGEPGHPLYIRSDTIPFKLLR